MRDYQILIVNEKITPLPTVQNLDLQSPTSLGNSAFQRSIINSMSMGNLPPPYNNSTVKQKTHPSNNIELDTQNQVLKVKVYNELVANIVKIRHLRNNNVTKLESGYQTNRLIAPLGTYFILKSLTPSGFVKDYCKQIGGLLAVLKLCKKTFYSHVKELETLKLVTRRAGTLQLASYEYLLNTFEITEVSNITYINYDPTQKIKIKLLLLGSVIHEKHTYIQKTVQAKIARQDELVAYINNGSKSSEETDRTKNLPQKLLRLHCMAFEKGETTGLEAFNADTQITARKIREILNFKSYKSVAYLKHQFRKANLANITKRSFISIDRKRLHYQYVEYLHSSKTTRWHLPDLIEFREGIYA